MKLKPPYRILRLGNTRRDGEDKAYVLYLSRRFSDDPMQNQSAVFIYGAVYSTKKAMELILADDDLLWITPNKVQSETGIIIDYRWPAGKKTLQDIWNHEYTVAEMVFEHRDPYRRECLKFRHSKPIDWSAEPTPREKRRSGAPRSSRQGMTPIADIAMACGVTAREARAAFRKAKIKKPAQGWAFPPDQVDEITKKLKEALGQ